MCENEKLIETCASSELIFDGKVLHVYVDQINLPNGAHGFREYIRHIGAVAVLPLTENDEVICVRQYRYAVQAVVTEIPAGKFGKLDFAIGIQSFQILQQNFQIGGKIFRILGILGRQSAADILRHHHSLNRR